MSNVEELRSVTVQGAFTSSQTHPLVLNLLLLDAFGADYLQWEPETLWLEIGRTWGSVSEASKNKIQAVRTAMVSDQPYERWEVFSALTEAFYGYTPRFDLVQLPTIHRVAGTLDVLSILRDKQIGDEVYKFAAAVMMDTGVIFGPGPLLPANKYLTKNDPALQAKVSAAMTAGKQPDGLIDTPYDLQLMKSISIRDFLQEQSASLLKQTEIVK